MSILPSDLVKVFTYGESQNPTVQSVYPLPMTLNILRTLQPSLTPIPNVTGFGAAGSIYAQLWYAGVEQFYCQANSCKQVLASKNQNTTNWNCHNLQCTCISDTTLCGGPSELNLNSTINGLTGDITVSCSGLNSSNTATCAFQQSVLQSIFGASGLSLSDCSFGECVQQSVIDESSSSGPDVTNTKKELDGGVIAGLVVVCVLLLLALVLLVLGLLKQKKMRKGAVNNATKETSGGIGVVWTDLSYVIPGAGSRNWLGKKRLEGFSDDKVILDGLSGTVLPGQMMAILGPSGKRKTSTPNYRKCFHRDCFQAQGRQRLLKSLLVRTCPGTPLGSSLFHPPQTILPNTTE